MIIILKELTIILIFYLINSVLKKNIYIVNVLLTIFFLFGGIVSTVELFNLNKGFGIVLLNILIWIVGGLYVFFSTFYVYENGNLKEDKDEFLLLNKTCPKCYKKLPSIMTKKCPHCTSDL